MLGITQSTIAKNFNWVLSKATDSLNPNDGVYLFQERLINNRGKYSQEAKHQKKTHLGVSNVDSSLHQFIWVYTFSDFLDLTECDSILVVNYLNNWEPLNKEM